MVEPDRDYAVADIIKVIQDDDSADITVPTETATTGTSASGQYPRVRPRSGSWGGVDESDEDVALEVVGPRAFGIDVDYRPAI